MTTTPVPTDPALASLRVLDAAQIEAMPWEPVEHCPGVSMKVLWRFDDYVNALLRAEPGAAVAGRPHLAAHHHVWVVSGEASIGDRRLTAGSYLHVPPGVAHQLEAGPAGCVLLQVHRPHAPREAERTAST